MPNGGIPSGHEAPEAISRPEEQKEKYGIFSKLWSKIKEIAHKINEKLDDIYNQISLMGTRAALGRETTNEIIKQSINKENKQEEYEKYEPVYNDIGDKIKKFAEEKENIKSEISDIDLSRVVSKSQYNRLLLTEEKLSNELAQLTIHTDALRESGISLSPELKFELNRQINDKINFVSQINSCIKRFDEHKIDKENNKVRQITEPAEIIQDIIEEAKIERSDNSIEEITEETPENICSRLEQLLKKAEERADSILAKETLTEEDYIQLKSIFEEVDNEYTCVGEQINKLRGEGTDVTSLDQEHFQMSVRLNSLENKCKENNRVITVEYIEDYVDDSVDDSFFFEYDEELEKILNSDTKQDYSMDESELEL